MPEKKWQTWLLVGFFVVVMITLLVKVLLFRNELDYLCKQNGYVDVELQKVNGKHEYFCIDEDENRESVGKLRIKEGAEE
ncbi:MAG: hypothetical protein WCT18_01810 [Patescibacteria group bacterium]